MSNEYKKERLNLVAKQMLCLWQAHHQSKSPRYQTSKCFRPPVGSARIASRNIFLGRLLTANINNALETMVNSDYVWKTLRFDATIFTGPAQ